MSSNALNVPGLAGMAPPVRKPVLNMEQPDIIKRVSDAMAGDISSIPDTAATFGRGLADLYGKGDPTRLKNLISGAAKSTYKLSTPGIVGSLMNHEDMAPTIAGAAEMVLPPALLGGVPATSPSVPESLRRVASPKAEVTPAAQAAPAQVAPESPKSSYVYTPIDTSSPVSGDFYHGTKANISDLSQADPAQYGRTEAKYGVGTYLTDNPEVAKGYAKTKGSGPVGRVHAGTLTDARLIDLEKPFPPNVQKVFDKLGIFDEPNRLPEGATGKDVFENLKQDMVDAGYYSGDALEAYQNIATELKSMGYDGFRHEGGAARGTGPHNVAILFPDYGGGINRNVLSPKVDLNMLREAATK